MVECLSTGWQGIANVFVDTVCLVQKINWIGITIIREYSIQKSVEHIRQKVADEANHFLSLTRIVFSP